MRRLGRMSCLTLPGSKSSVNRVRSPFQSSVSSGNSASGISRPRASSSTTCSSPPRCPIGPENCTYIRSRFSGMTSSAGYTAVTTVEGTCTTAGSEITAIAAGMRGTSSRASRDGSKTTSYSRPASSGKSGTNRTEPAIAYRPATGSGSSPGCAAPRFTVTRKSADHSSLVRFAFDSADRSRPETPVTSTAGC